MLAHEPLDHLDVARLVAEALGGPACDGRTRGAVVGRARQLADVVQQRGHEQQVGALDVAQERPRPHDRLDEVAVDRVPVHGVALRPRAHAGPPGHPRAHQPGQVAGLPGRRRDPARHPAGRGTPRAPAPSTARWSTSARRGGARQVLDGHGRQRQPEPGRRRRRPQRERRVGARVDAHAEHHLAVVLDQAVPERPQHRPARPAPQPPGRRRLAGPARRRVEREGHRARRLRHPREQVVGVVGAHETGDGVLLGQQQRVAGLAAHHLQGVPDVEQHAVRGVHRHVRPVGEPRRRQGAQHRDVAQPAAALLEVGLEQERAVAVALGALVDGTEQLGQPAPRRPAPVVEQPAAGRRDQLGVARHHAQVEQPDAGREVVAADVPALRRGAHRVVEAHPGVPDRVPEPLGQRRDVRRGQGVAVVQQHEVEVARRAGLTAREAAHRRERHAGRRSRGPPPRLPTTRRSARSRRAP